MIPGKAPDQSVFETPGDASYGKYCDRTPWAWPGTTLGNALRRILLSSLPGTAATIKIAGVRRRFSTIPGVKGGRDGNRPEREESADEAALRWPKTVFIEATGPCEVTAGDIRLMARWRS